MMSITAYLRHAGMFFGDRCAGNKLPAYYRPPLWGGIHRVPTARGWGVRGPDAGNELPAYYRPPLRGGFGNRQSGVGAGSGNPCSMIAGRGCPADIIRYPERGFPVDTIHYPGRGDCLVETI